MGALANSLHCCCPNKQKYHVVDVKDICETDCEIKPIKRNQRAKTIEEIGIMSSNFVMKRNSNPNLLYSILEELGEGAYGRVIKVKNIKTNEIKAMKIIDKSQINSEFDLEEIANEINILKTLDHPNILKVYEYYDYNNSIFIVNELIPNGDLFSLIKEKKSFNELLALRILQQMLSAVKFLHSENIVHGDIKPENIMIDNFKNVSFNNKRAMDYDDIYGFEIKLIDFGTSKIFNKSKVFNQLQGTAHYVAPEVILGAYHKQCDLWSCGVVFYVMLSGNHPFSSDNDDEEELYEKIKNDDINFSTKELKRISSESMELLKKLLEKDPIERLTSTKALNHIAFKKLENIKNQNKDLVTRTYSKQALKRLGTIKKNQIFQQAITSFITHNCLSKEIAHKHKEIFKAIDANGDGRITTSELISGYKNAGLLYTQEEIQAIIKAIDTDHNGYIEMEEFISASVDLNVLLSDSNLKMAFESIDLDNSGAVSFEEIGKFIGGGECDEELMKQVVLEVGKSPEDEFDYEDFKEIMLTLRDQGKSSTENRTKSYINNDIKEENEM